MRSGTGSTPFDQAIAAIRNGADYSLSGRTLIVNGITLAITDEQFDIAYDVMDEVDGDESVLVFRDSLVSIRKGNAEDGYHFKAWPTGRTWACHARSPFEWARSHGFESKQDAEWWGADAIDEFQRNDALHRSGDE